MPAFGRSYRWRKRGAEAAPRSGAANLVEESPDPAAQRVGVTAEVRRRLGYPRRGAAGVACGTINPGDVLRHVLDAPGGLLHVASDVLRRCTLLVDRRSDGHGDAVDLGDGSADAADRFDGVAGHLLDR